MRSAVLGAVLVALLAGPGAAVRRVTASRSTQPNGPARECYGGVLAFSPLDCYSALIVDIRTGKTLSTVRLDGPVLAAAADGRGGWYVGGSFKHVGVALRKRLAHFDADGRLDPHWRPAANGNGVSVRSVVAARGRVYIAGDFAFVNQRPRRALASLDARTGQLDERWRPQGSATSLAFAAGRVIADGVQAFDPTNGKAVWTTDLGAGFEGGGVKTTAVRGSLVYLAGIFSRVDRVPRRGLAAVEARTGRIDRAWRPPAWRVPYCIPCNGVTAIAASPTRVYAARSGDGGATVAALDARSGAPDRRWRVSLDGTAAQPSTVNGVAVADRHVFIGGDFRRVDGSPRRGVAAFDPTSGRPLPMPRLTSNSVNITTVAPSGPRVLVAGLLTNAVSFTFSHFRAYGLFSRRRGHLRVGASLSGPGTLRIDLGRTAPERKCVPLGDCPGTVVATRTLALTLGRSRVVAFDVAALGPGRYFIRFIPRGRGGPRQPALAFAFRLTR